MGRNDQFFCFLFLFFFFSFFFTSLGTNTYPQPPTTHHTHTFPLVNHGPFFQHRVNSHEGYKKGTSRIVNGSMLGDICFMYFYVSHSLPTVLKILPDNHLIQGMGFSLPAPDPDPGDFAAGAFAQYPHGGQAS